MQLLLLASLAFGLAGAIRLLREGPMIDAEGREYKSAGPKPSVSIRCTEVSMILTVRADFFKNGRRVPPTELFVGEARHWQSARCRGDPAAEGDNEYVIEVGLMDCGAELSMSEDFMIYSNYLIVSPPSVNHHIITRKPFAAVPVSCHYKRSNVVSSRTHNSPRTFRPPPPVEAAEERSDFSLRLMRDDWSTETFSRVFYVGDLLHLEASYTGPGSRKRRLYLDSCVATLTPDPTSVPRYKFIENHGCLIDAKRAGSMTWFQPRARPNSLRLQLETFLLSQATRNSIFITCQLEANTDMWTGSSSSKACNYERNRWRNVDGSGDVCRCCDATCPSSPRRSDTHRKQSEAVLDYATVSVGPLTIFSSK